MQQENHFQYPRTFVCKQCGRVVTTIAGTIDRRQTFCSPICSRRYWRHSTRRKKVEKSS
ncbi:hypothetical protein [Streptococcus himalayensis]|uniref:hypothetical protein n=2 Tax=Streptococcus himalayensis TaxID=1888195 RepID=UPI00166E432A|nr:hypothetical protein [Streptococcus himalayensis]